MSLLTEAEAAALLGVTKSKIKRLRKIGGLPFLKGRPVLIEEDDLIAFQVAEAEQKAVAAGAAAAAAAAAATKRKRNPGPEIGSPEYEEEQRDNLYRRVLQTRLKLHYRNLRRETAKDGR